MRHLAEDTPTPHIGVSRLNVTDSRHRFLHLFAGAKEMRSGFSSLNRTYHFITRCFGPLDIQLPPVRMRDKNCATVGGLLGSWEM